MYAISAKDTNPVGSFIQLKTHQQCHVQHIYSIISAQLLAYQFQVKLIIQ